MLLIKNPDFPESLFERSEKPPAWARRAPEILDTNNKNQLILCNIPNSKIDLLHFMLLMVEKV